MKRITVLAACAFMFGATLTFAQDTTKTKSQSDQTRPQSDQLNNRPAQTDMTGWTKVNTSEVPANLRTTLSNQQYAGWDNPTNSLYKNTTGEYTLRMGEPNNQKSYYFDKNGKVKTKPDNN